MRTVSCAAFDGRVTFHTRHVSLAAYELMENLTAAAKEANPAAMEKYEGMMNTLIFLLAVTPKMDFAFTGDENPVLLDLQDFWENYQKLITKGAYVKAMTLAIDWRKETSTELVNQWVQSVEIAQSPVRRPETLPFEQLTPEEKEQASDPDSPLLKSA